MVNEVQKSNVEDRNKSDNNSNTCGCRHLIYIHVPSYSPRFHILFFSSAKNEALDLPLFVYLVPIS